MHGYFTCRCGQCVRASQRPNPCPELTAPVRAAYNSEYEVRQAPNGDLNREGTLRRLGQEWCPEEYHTRTFRMRCQCPTWRFRFASR